VGNGWSGAASYASERDGAGWGGMGWNGGSGGAGAGAGAGAEEGDLGLRAD